jgi:hypothetical protein
LTAYRAGEFKVYYQPEVLPQTGESFDMEALGALGACGRTVWYAPAGVSASGKRLA